MRPVSRRFGGPWQMSSRTVVGTGRIKLIGGNFPGNSVTLDPHSTNENREGSPFIVTSGRESGYARSSPFDGALRGEPNQNPGRVALLLAARLEVEVEGDGAVLVNAVVSGVVVAGVGPGVYVDVVDARAVAVGRAVRGHARARLRPVRDRRKSRRRSTRRGPQDRGATWSLFPEKQGWPSGAQGEGLGGRRARLRAPGPGRARGHAGQGLGDRSQGRRGHG